MSKLRSKIDEASGGVEPTVSKLYRGLVKEKPRTTGTREYEVTSGRYAPLKQGSDGKWYKDVTFERASKFRNNKDEEIELKDVNNENNWNLKEK